MVQTNKGSQTLPIGYELQCYKVEQILGEGGFGITYLAHDNSLDRQVAIKEFMPRDMTIRATNMTIQPIDDSSGDMLQWGLERFIREAKTVSKFDHPNIVRVHSVFEENCTAYMIMSYEEGMSFLERLQKGDQPSEEELIEIILPLLDGLEVMHAEGVIHRDIKPANIFIRKNGSPVLIDFGSAREAMGDETKTLTSFISPGYAPFEQYHGKSDVQGPWTDIYSLGATLYRAIIGKPPMDSSFRNRLTDEQAIEEIREILDKYSDTYSTLFLRAIEHAIRSNHKDRPQTIDEWRTMFTGLKAVDSGTKISNKILIIIFVLAIINITIAGVFLYLN